jgi:hypothetical protein
MAARMMAESGVRDYQIAKQRAAERLGARDNLPGNEEIERAFIEYRELFQPQAHAAMLRRLRAAAYDAMEFFAPFRPRLVGPVLSGAAAEHSDVSLHLFSESPEEVALFLVEHKIPHDVTEKRFRENRNGYRSYPAFRFVAGDVPIEVTVFPREGLKQSPLSPVDGRPMRRADRATVAELLTGA